MAEDDESKGLGVGTCLSGLILWLIALGGLAAGLKDPIYLVAAAIAAVFLFHTRFY